MTYASLFSAIGLSMVLVMVLTVENVISRQI